MVKMQELLAKFNNKNFAQRVFSALVLIPIVLGIVWSGGLAYKMLIIAAMILGMHEWLGLTVRKMTPSLETAAMLGVLACLGIGAFFKPLWGIEAMVPATLILFYFAQDSFKSYKHWLRCSLWAAGGMPYLVLSGLALLHVRSIEDSGFFATLYLLLVVWGTDIGAYFAGRAIGGAKIAPKISPNKTWAGLGGGMALAAVLAYLVAWGFGDSRPWGAAIVAAVLAVVSQAGDFFESHAKRRAGMKDSGALIPGHGGLLDRVDGLLFAAMAWSLFLVIGNR